MVNYKKVEQFVENDLKNQTPYLELASVSAQNKEISETAEYLKNAFEKLGADDVQVLDKHGFPAVYAYFKGNSDKTVMFYSHYDVQPPEPLNEWKSDPFKATFKDGKLYARGVCDCKGDMMARLSIVKYFKEHGGLPCNVKFFTEGEEEIGSLNVEKYVQDLGEKMSTDAIFWETGLKDENEKLNAYCGVKGIVAFDIEVTTAKTDAHSSLAAYLPNAAWRLIKGLSSLYDDKLNIHVEGFKDNVESLDEYTQKVIAEGEKQFDKKKIVANHGLVAGKLPVAKPFYAEVNEPTMTINGLTSGYEGEGVKTVIPCYAKAKLDCRLVPGQDPIRIAKLIQKQLEKNGYGDLKVTFNLGEHAYRSNLKSEFIQKCIQVGKKVYSEQGLKLVPNSAGGGPMYPFYKATKAPIVGVGVGYSSSMAHAPNENIRVRDYKQLCTFLATVLENFGN